MKEAVDERHVCIVAENSITVCLLNGMLLKFERKFYPFQVGRSFMPSSN